MKLTPFDRFVFVILAAFLLMTGVVAVRGDQVGVQILTTSPLDGARAVPIQAQIHVAFDQQVVLTGNLRALNIEPATSGTAQWSGQTLTFFPEQPLEPDTTYTITIPKGLTSSAGQTTRDSYRWQFHTGHPRVVYLTPDSQNQYQLTAVDPTIERSAVQLTQEKSGIWDYAVSPDGKTAVYATVRSDASSELWSVDLDGQNRRLLLACPDASCSGPVWSPELEPASGGVDARRLVYERRELGPDGAQRPPRLWWLDPATGETVPVFEDNQWLGFSARFSPDGQWLAYVAPHLQAIAVYNLKDGRSLEIPSQLGEPPLWSPDGAFLLTTDMVARDDGMFAAHLFRVNVESGQSVDLSSETTLSNSSPAWSPDGDSIAYGNVDGDGPGAQIWAMSATGEERRALTDDPAIRHAALSWSPDGRYLLFQRTVLQQMATAEIWIMDMETGATRRLADSGAWPSWTP